MGADQGALAGALQLLAMSLVPMGLGWAALLAPRVVGRWRERQRRAALPEPWRRPLQDVAADLRRLAAALDDAPPGTPRARLAATAMAYDDVLREACAALGVPEHLAARARTGDLLAERERVEMAVEGAGLRIRPRRTA